jgi:hypothetical protein
MNMNEPTKFQTTKLSDKAMLVKLTIRRAALTRRDDQVTNAIQQQYGDNSLSAFTKLFRADTSPVYHIMRAVNEVYTYHKANTLPYVDAGPRILPSANYMDYTQEMRSKIAHVEAMLAQWMPMYDQLVKDDVLYRNGGAPTGRASANDYPSADEFAARMSFDLRFSPMPDKKHFLFDLSDEDEQAFDRAIDDAFKLARNDSVQRMLEPLGYLVKRLDEYKGEKGERFHASNLENVLEGCRMARRLAIDPPQELVDTIKELERAVIAYSFDITGLKESQATRDGARARLAAIADKMALFGG